MGQKTLLSRRRGAKPDQTPEKLAAKVFFFFILGSLIPECLRGSVKCGGEQLTAPVSAVFLSVTESKDFLHEDL